MDGENNGKPYFWKHPSSYIGIISYNQSYRDPYEPISTKECQPRAWETLRSFPSEDEEHCFDGRFSTHCWIGKRKDTGNSSWDVTLKGVLLCIESIFTIHQLVWMSWKRLCCTTIFNMIVWSQVHQNRQYLSLLDFVSLVFFGQVGLNMVKQVGEPVFTTYLLLPVGQLFWSCLFYHLCISLCRCSLTMPKPWNKVMESCCFDSRQLT